MGRGGGERKVEMRGGGGDEGDVEMGGVWR